MVERERATGRRAAERSLRLGRRTDAIVRMLLLEGKLATIPFRVSYHSVSRGENAGKSGDKVIRITNLEISKNVKRNQSQLLN